MIGFHRYSRLRTPPSFDIHEAWAMIVHSTHESQKMNQTKIDRLERMRSSANRECRWRECGATCEPDHRLLPATQIKKKKDCQACRTQAHLRISCQYRIQTILANTAGWRNLKYKNQRWMRDGYKRTAATEAPHGTNDVQAMTANDLN